MENLNGHSDDELAVWTTSFAGGADPTPRSPHEPQTQHRQYSQGPSSQSHCFQTSQLAFLSSSDDRPPATPHFLSDSIERETTPQNNTVAPAPPSLPQPAKQPPPPPPPPQQQRSTEETPLPIKATRSPMNSHPHNGEVPTFKYFSPSSLSSALPRPSKITPAAVAAAAAGMLPLCTSHPSGTSDTDMEVKGECLEDYLKLQDDDEVDCAEGSTTYPGRQTSDLVQSGSQQSQPSRTNGRSSLWVSDLCDIAGDVSSCNNNSKNNTNMRDFNGMQFARSPCTPIEVDTMNTGSLRINNNNTTSPGAHAGATTAMAARLCAGPVKKAQPPPLSGFAPVAVVTPGSAPPENKANSISANNSVYYANTNNTTIDGGNRVWSHRSTTPQPLSLASSLKVSPSSHNYGSFGLVNEERRLKEELHALRQRVCEAEQRLSTVQRRIAESSLNGGGVPPAAGPAGGGATELETQRFYSQPPLQAAAKVMPTEARPPEVAATGAAATAVPTQGVYMVSTATAPRYALGAPAMELRRTPPQQQQLQVLPSSMASKVYVASAPPSTAVTMTRPPSTDSSRLAGSGMTYIVQNGTPFGVYAIPSTGTLVDAAGNAIQANGVYPPSTTTNATSTHSTTAAAAAVLSTPSPAGGSTMQVVGTQSYMVNNQPTICYMVLAPQTPQQSQQQQQQKLTPSVSPPEFGSHNNNSSSSNGGVGGNIHMKGATYTHVPVLPTAPTTATATATAKTQEVLPSYPHVVMVGPASNAELTRKCFNVHGSMMGVVPYFPYDEGAPPAPTATILTAVATSSPGASVPGQSMSGACWSMRSGVNGNGGGADLVLGNSGHSHDGLTTMNDSSVVPPCSCGSNTPPNNAKSSTTPTTPGDPSTAPVLPIFIQMFPCELHDRAKVLNRVMEATCGRDFGVVQRIEPRSETSFIAHVRTHHMWHLIYKLRCRVLMDRFGFWYAADLDQYIRMKEYCEGVRRLPQQTRHFQTDGLPCMPLVVELSRAVEKAVVMENNAPRTFDEIVPIAAVDRHRTRLHSTTTASTGTNGSTMPNTDGRGGAGMGFAPAMMPPAGGFAEATTTGGENTANAVMIGSNIGNGNSALVLSGAPLPQHQQQQQQHWSIMTTTGSEMSFRTSNASLGGSTRAGQAMYMEGHPSPHQFM